jgi:uncharacterized phiE125 gp8 family phage protein
VASILAKTRDLTALPAALLTQAKGHCRIDGSYDDTFVTSAIGRAIDLFERKAGISVFATQWEWRPDQTDFCNNVAKVPVSPVDTWSAKDAGNADVGASFTLTSMSTHGVGLYAFNGAWVDGLVFTIGSGYAAAALPYGILDAVLRCTAHLYEHREILVPGQDMATPGWFMDEIATYWMPRA